MSDNPQLDLAYHFVQYTGCNIFLTGKAGTGKTTFLHTLKKTSLKRMIVVAPTGVAAINAGGVTIHSFFQLPFGPYIPQQGAVVREKKQFQKFSREKINLIHSLDLLVIDEISMVRSDTLDAIDEVLRRYKNRNKPFGGAQLLMIGDLHQLSPVVKEEEWNLLKSYYRNQYFFSSLALQKTSPVNIELKHIYRQSDQAFISLLNHVRENRISADILNRLNERYIPDFDPGEEGYITLTTHNDHAKKINKQKLEMLEGRPYTFNAEINGDFPEYAYPADPELIVKVGAQVMFLKNDSSRDKLFYNGKIGKIISIKEEQITVSCPGDVQDILVARTEWQNFKYELNTTSKEINERVAGAFSQYPLKLAWAITIHKSQGLTFERAIIDAGASFAHGQVYVALSRCKSFEGMVLRSPISIGSVKTDGTIASYTRDAEDNQPGDEQLLKAKIDFQHALLFELFNFNELKSRFFQCRKQAQDHESSLTQGFISEIDLLKLSSETDLYPVAETFKRQLAQLFTADTLPEESALIQERVMKACSWFAIKLDSGLFVPVNGLTVESDNKEVKKALVEALDNLRKELYIKLASMRLCESGFSTLSFLKARANAELDFESLKKTALQKVSTPPAEIHHPALYTALKTWRDNLAAEQNVPVYRILPQKTLVELAEKRPTTRTSLKEIKGIGKQKAGQYAEQILEIIRGYCEEHHITLPPGEQERAADVPAKPAITPTKDISFQLFKEGRSLEEIAVARGLTPSTIMGHLSHFAGKGEIEIAALVPKSKVDSVLTYLQENSLAENPLTQLRIAMGDEYSFAELRVILDYFEFLKR